MEKYQAIRVDPAASAKRGAAGGFEAACLHCQQSSKARKMFILI
jgi:hypothetical protein